MRRYRRWVETGAFEAMPETLAEMVGRDRNTDMTGSAIVRSAEKGRPKRPGNLVDGAAASPPSSMPDTKGRPTGPGERLINKLKNRRRIAPVTTRPRNPISALSPSPRSNYGYHLVTREGLAGVIVECLPWQALIERWDRPGMLFFLDPPYYSTKHYYGRGMSARSEYEAPAERLKSLRGRFTMILNDAPAVRETFAGLALDPVELSYTVGGNQTAKAMRELIITEVHSPRF